MVPVVLGQLIYGYWIYKSTLWIYTDTHLLVQHVSSNQPRASLVYLLATTVGIRMYL